MKAINVYPRLFGGPMRAGDLIAACNFLEYLRNITNEPELKLYIPLQSIQPSEHCRIMRNYLKSHTDYIVTEEDNFIDGELLQLQITPGTDPTYLDMYNLFNIRKNTLYKRQNVFFIDDMVTIPNKNAQENIIIIHPLIDADYNFERNWSLEYLQNIIDKESIQNYEKFIICSKDIINGINIKNFTYCHNFLESLEYISKCKKYIGGDTGLSHFAGALNPGPNVREYHYSKNTYGTTNPMNFMKNGTMIYY